MASTYVKLTGELWWVRVHTPETDPWGNSKWKASIYPDKESLLKIMDLQAEGVRNTLKKDEKGYYTGYSRPTEKKIKGRVEKFNPPTVFQADGKTPITDFVGNGSKGSLKLEVYTHPTPNGGKGTAARLDSIQVDELIPVDLEKGEGSSSEGF